MAYGFDRAGRTLQSSKWPLWGSEHWLRVGAWTLVLVLHVLFFYMLLRPPDAGHGYYPTPVGNVLMVKLIPSQHAAPPEPVPLPPLAQTSPRIVPPVSPGVPQHPPSPSVTQAEPILHLYAPNGRLYLPEKAWRSPPGVSAFQAHIPHGNLALQNRQVIHYRSTVFSNSWIPENVGSLNQWLSEYVRKTTQKMTLPLRFPGNTHFTCYILLFPPSGGCGFVGPKQASSFHRPRNADTIQQLPSLLLAPHNPHPAPSVSVALPDDG